MILLHVITTLAITAKTAPKNRARGKEIKTASRLETLRQFDAVTKNMLLYEIAPLMQWRNIGGSEAAHKFDLLVCRMQTEHLKQSSSFDDLKAELQGQVDELRMNLSQVKAVGPLIVQGSPRSRHCGRGLARQRCSSFPRFTP